MSKYKFTLAQKVKDWVAWQLEHYHEDKKQLEQYKNDMIPSPIASYSLAGGCGSGSVSQPTENLAIKMATSAYIIEIERNIATIDRVLSVLSETDKQLIDLVYWKRTYTIAGAGMKVGLSTSKAYQHINNILGLIALERGYVNI